MATKDKARKKEKLRHAEYYDFQEIQDELYADSLKGREFKHLVDIILLPENIRLAYRNIKANRGSKTAGTDGRTIRDLEKLSDEKLVALVQRKLDWYEPQSVRRVEIPKGNDPTKKRPLGIPTILGKNINTGIMHYLMRNPIPYRSAAYNDNRISLYCAQFGKCAVTGEMLNIGDIHCHHKLPRYLGGTDEYKNLVIVCENIHRLIHATNPETIRKYMEKLKLTPKQLKKLKKLRSLAHVESCLQFDAIKYLDGKPDEVKVSRPV